VSSGSYGWLPRSLLAFAFYCGLACQGGDEEPIRVGVLHSLSGTMAISETPVADATKLAIEQLNQDGGVLGRPLEVVSADGRSDWPSFAMESQRLITREGVSVVFGCWTSASRKTVRPVFEGHGHLLFYPVQYEGMEQSPNIVYTGAAPNQQIVPAVKWCHDHLGKRFFLVASDYVFPRAANEVIRNQVAALGAHIVGEAYLPLGSDDVQGVVQSIVELQPDVILNTINGDSNIAFFRALRAAGISPERIPTMSFSIAEPELQALPIAEMVGDLATWNYFQSLASVENRSFVDSFKARFGEDRVVSDPMEAAYFGVRLWAQTVEEVGTDDLREVLPALGGQSLVAPGGMVHIDSQNHHTWKTVRIGRIRADGQFDVVWDSDRPVRPVPYPSTRPKATWDAFLAELHKGWGGHWSAPTGESASP